MDMSTVAYFVSLSGLKKHIGQTLVYSAVLGNPPLKKKRKNYKDLTRFSGFACSVGTSELGTDCHRQAQDVFS